MINFPLENMNVNDDRKACFLPVDIIGLAYPETGPEDGNEAEAVLLLHTSHSLTAPQRTTVLRSQSND